MWIYKYKAWSNFTWNVSLLTNKLTEIRYQQARLLGQMDTLGFESRQEANLNTLTIDVVKSASIEGEILNSIEVRSSIARRLGIKLASMRLVSRDVEGIVEMMLDATQNYNKPLTAERLFNWHATLFPTGRSGMYGNWRNDENGPIQVFSGPIDHEIVHFKAPDASQLNQEMTSFLTWFESTDNVDPILKAGIAHLWFVTIHPFEDGNGRIGRTIADMALAQADKMSNRFYSLSAQFAAERREYYQQLENQQRGTLDITNWLAWFLDCLGRAIVCAQNTISGVLFRARLWEKVNQESVNERQRFIINRMLADDFKGYMNTSKYATLAKCSTDTALRDIQILRDRGILIQNPGKGRSTSYHLLNEI